MTYLEKHLKEHRSATGCPSDYGDEPVYDCAGVGCTACWNREMPEEKRNDFTRAEILDTAKRIVTGDREQQYGSPEDNFAQIGKYWSVYLGHEITAHDVAIMMALLKIARIQSGQVKADNYIDMAGYAACAAEIAGGKQDA